MAEKKQLVVTAACIVPKLEDGTFASPLYFGAPVPAGLDKEHLQHLVDIKMVGEAEKVEQAEPADPNKAPAKSASKGEWVAYATNEARGDQRLSAEDAEKATRDDLAARYSA